MSAILSEDEETHSPLALKDLSLSCNNHNNNSSNSISSSTHHKSANNSGNSKDEADIVAKSLVGVVDIGSNGIRFSISSIAPHHARLIPCVFKDRLNVSLFEVQYENGNCKITEKSPIPNEVIYEVCRAMKRFQIICSDFGVDKKSVRVVATEATREAQNSEYFRHCIHETTGWDVELLSKEDEGKIGSYGVVSSFHGVSGLFMDLGGGSTQINWIHTDDTGEVQFSKKPISLPYGAAALTRRLRTENERDLFLEIKDAYKQAIKDLDIPEFLIEKARARNGFELYCSGGGLRGLGNLLLSQNPQYPITTIINGYSSSYNDISSLTNYLFLKKNLPVASQNVFRVSERRKQQLPAIGLLLSAAFESLPKIKTIHFSQGGVREGALFEKLPRFTRAQDPLIVATKPYAPFLVDRYLNLLRSSLPEKHVPAFVYQRVAPALCNLAFVHCMYPKELQPTAALHTAITGIIAGSHGLSHRARALIGLALCERWGAELPENQQIFKDSLINSVFKENFSDSELSDAVFWTLYIGKIMFFICGIHPGGNINEVNPPFEFEVKTKEIKDSGSDDPTSKHASFSNNTNNNNTTTVTNPQKTNVDTAVLGDDINDAIEQDTHNKSSVQLQPLPISEIPVVPKRYKFETVVRIDSQNLKIGSGAGNRIKSISKKIKKLSKTYNVKLKFDIRYVTPVSHHHESEHDSAVISDTEERPDAHHEGHIGTDYEARAGHSYKNHNGLGDDIQLIDTEKDDLDENDD